MGLEDIEVPEGRVAFMPYRLLDVFSTSAQLTPPLRDPSKVFVGTITIKGEMQITSAVLYRTMVVYGPTGVLTSTFDGHALNDHMPRGLINIEQPASDAPLAAGNALNQSFRVSPLAPFHIPGVEGYVSHGGTAIGAALGSCAKVIHDSGTQRVEVPDGTGLVLIAIMVNIGAWHDLAENGIRLIGRNLYFPFCSDPSADGITLYRGLLVPAQYHEQ